MAQVFTLILPTLTNQSTLPELIAQVQAIINTLNSQLTVTVHVIDFTYDSDA